MFTNFIFKKEIPDELKIIEQVFGSKIKEIETNKFLLAEKNGLPFYIQPSHNNLQNANDDKIFFFNFGELLKMTPSGVENRIEEKSKSYLKMVLDYFGYITNFNQLRELFVYKSDGFNKLINEEMKTNLIKLISVNCYGNLITMITRHNLLIVLNTEKNEGRLYNPKVSNLNEYLFKSGEIIHLQWSPVERDNIILAMKDKILSIKINEDLEVTIIKSINNFNNISKIKFSHNSEWLLILHENGKSLSILDTCNHFTEIFSKHFLFESKKEIQTSQNYFILYSDSSISIFNTLNLNFKTWTDFKGKINSVQISNNSKHIFIFTEEAYLYIIYNIEEDFYNIKNNSASFNNIPQYYSHSDFKVSNKIFSLNLENKKIIKAMMNEMSNRLVILYQNDLKNELKNELRIFDVVNFNLIHEIKIDMICSVKNLRDLNVTDFDIKTNIKNGEEIIFIIWGEKYVSKTYLNATNFNIK